MTAPDENHDQDPEGGDRLAAERHAKLERLRAEGVDPYPVGVRVTHPIAAVVEAYADRLEAAEETTDRVAVGGRVVMRRGHGKLVFLVLREGDDELQAMAQIDV